MPHPLAIVEALDVYQRIRMWRDMYHALNHQKGKVLERAAIERERRECAYGMCSEYNHALDLDPLRAERDAAALKG